MKLFKMFGRAKTDEDVEDQLEALGDIEEEDYLDDLDDESEDEDEEQASEQEEEEAEEDEGEDVVSLEEEKGKAEAGAGGEGGASAAGGAAVQTVSAGPAESADDMMNLFQEEAVEELLPEFLMNQLSDIKGSQLLQECADIKRRLVGARRT